MTVYVPVQVGADDWEDFEYDVPYEVISTYFEEMDDAKLAELAEEAFDRLSDEDKQFYYTECKEEMEDGNIIWSKVIKADRSFVVDLVEDDEDLYEEDIVEIVESDAIEQYEDAVEYEKDPLGYYGMSYRDFI